MPFSELEARESFYGTMLWIVNGAPFAEKFSILGRLPSPEAAWTRDIVFYPQAASRDGRMFRRISEQKYPESGFHLVHGVDEIQGEIDAHYVGHHFYDWVRPRSVWFDSCVPVYLDFGGDLLWQLQNYRGSELRCVQAVWKKLLIARHGGSYSETGEVWRRERPPPRNLSVVYKGQDEVLLHAIAR